MSSVTNPDAKRRTSTMAAMQSSSFRLYFAGQLVSVSGTWMQAIAQQVVVYDLTKSELVLGIVALAQGIPALLLTSIAGVVVERFPRRQILIVTQTIQMILAFIMAALYFTHSLQVWHIVALSFGIGVSNALDAPARQAFVVEMVGREDLTSGIVLQSIMFNMARVVGPALGGLALATVGAGWCFFLNGVSFLAVLLSLIVMRVPAVIRPVGRMAIWQRLKEGMQFSRRHPTIAPLLLLSAITSIFGITFGVLIPAFADQVLHDTSGGTAALATAQGVGAILAGIVVARLSLGGYGGKAVTILALLGPFFVLVFALMTSYVGAMIMVAVAGFCLIGQFILMNTLIQNEVPDEFRGRVMALYTLTFFGFNPFSAVAIGAVAQQIGTVRAILIWGTASLVLSAYVLFRYRSVWRLR